MVRITRVHAEARPVTLKVEGRLTGPWIDVLEGAVALVTHGAGRVVLDVSGLTFADETGVAALRRLIGKDAELRGGSLFLSSLLSGDAS